MQPKNATILMTALVPTIGHQALVEFALNLVSTRNTGYGYVDLIISSRSNEPVSGKERVDAFRRQFVGRHQLFVHLHEDDNAPQNPSTPEEWAYWKDVVESRVNEFRGPNHKNYFVASEPYGKTMAELTNHEFVPFDIDRQFLNVKGSTVRDNLMKRFREIMPEFRKKMVTKVTMFGQESTGKTTMTKEINEWAMVGNSYAIHEFARPYLEMMDDKTVTDEKMYTITEGQYALQKMAYSHNDRPFIFQDTDLLSTIGYYRIYGGTPHPHIEEMFKETKSDLYIVMNDAIPFEPDPLRYGGAERETTKQFWIDLLEEFDCKYYVVQGTRKITQLHEIEDAVQAHIDSKYLDIELFARD